jgi:hypothetical protein
MILSSRFDFDPLMYNQLYRGAGQVALSNREQGAHHRKIERTLYGF